VTFTSPSLTGGRGIPKVIQKDVKTKIYHRDSLRGRYLQKRKEDTAQQEASGSSILPQK
jgi:hypothetical protein